MDCCMDSKYLLYIFYWSQANFPGTFYLDIKKKNQMSWPNIADAVYKKKILLGGGGATQLLSCKIYITDLVYAKIRFGHALYHSKFLRKTASALLLGHGDKTILWGLAERQINRRKLVHRVLSKWSLISIEQCCRIYSKKLQIIGKENDFCTWIWFIPNGIHRSSKRWAKRELW